jgi:predicted TIM-barrel fold metal-dependent hydrolase
MKANVVDVHSHLYPRRYIDVLRTRTEVPLIAGDPGQERFVIFDHERASGTGRPIDSTYWDVREKLAFMDRHGIDQSVISIGNPWLDPIDSDQALDLARQLNRDLASLEGDTGGRLCALGVLPAGEISNALEVAAEIVREPGLHGVITGPRPCGRMLDDQELEPLWELFDSTRLPVFLHPHYGAAMDDLAGYGHALPVGIAFPFETTVAIARLAFGGVLHRFPQLKLMAAHGGGTIPYLAGRLDAAWRSDPSTHQRLPVPPSTELARVAADAVLYHARAMRAAADLVGTSMLMFGTDHPFSVADPAANLGAARSEFTGEERTNLMSAAAQSFFGLPDIHTQTTAGRTHAGEKK